MLRAKFVLLAVTLLVLVAEIFSASPLDGANLWPYKYNPSVEPANPRNVTGLTVVVTGDSTKWGQGNGIARGWASEERAKVYGFSRSSASKVYNRTWTHASGDLRKPSQVKSFAKGLRKETKHVDVLYLNAGIMRDLFPQALDAENIQAGPIATNFFGNHGFFSELLEQGLLGLRGRTDVLWAGSIARYTYLAPLLDYTLSKLLMNYFVKLSELSGASIPKLNINHFVYNPYGVATKIACHNEVAIGKNFHCAAQMQAMRDALDITLANGTVIPRGFCSDSVAPDLNGMTNADDIFRLSRSLVRIPDSEVKASKKVHVISAAPYFLNAQGEDWDTFHAEIDQRQPAEYAQEWESSFLSQFYARCAHFDA